jgi:hypothetical protein
MMLISMYLLFTLWQLDSATEHLAIAISHDKSLLPGVSTGLSQSSLSMEWNGCSDHCKVMVRSSAVKWTLLYYLQMTLLPWSISELIAQFLYHRSLHIDSTRLRTGCYPDLLTIISVSRDNEIGVLYILMSKVSRKWEVMSHKEKIKILCQIGVVTCQLSRLQFSHIRSLFKDESGLHVKSCLSRPMYWRMRDIHLSTFHNSSTILHVVRY